MEHYATIVISYRRPDLLADVIERLSVQSVPPKRLVVVDNAGNLDEGILTSSAFADRVTLIRRGDNPGYGAAVNEARSVVHAEGYENLLVLTHDADFEPDLAERLIAALRGGGKVGAAAPVLFWSSERGRVFSAGGRLRKTGRASHLTQARDGAPYPVDWVDGAIVMYSVAALDAISWVDPDYFLYFEDVDTAWRMRSAGWQTVVDPSVRAFQQPGAHPMYLGIRNMARFSRTARIPAILSACGMLRRIFEEAAHRALHRRRPEIGRALVGWRDGRAGASGKPRGRQG